MDNRRSRGNRYEAWQGIRDGLAIDAESLKRRWGAPLRAVARRGSVLLSLLIVLAISYQAWHWEPGRLVFPTEPIFWVAFALYFLGSPAIEWIIIRRLWTAPLSGLIAVLRKMVCNELLLSYSGDAYFYTWLRTALPRVTAPFGIVKDLALISALMGSVVTLGSLVLLWPLVASGEFTAIRSPVLLAVALTLASGGVITFFGKRLLSLSRGEIRFIAAAYGARILGQASLAIVMWHSLLPQVPLQTWLAIASIRMLATRLPLFASKELAFATATMLLMGSASELTPMIMTITTLMLATNMIMAAGLSLEPWARSLAGRRFARA